MLVLMESRFLLLGNMNTSEYQLGMDVLGWLFSIRRNLDGDLDFDYLDAEVSKIHRDRL
jgi:hypothetical protein